MNRSNNRQQRGGTPSTGLARNGVGNLGRNASNLPGSRRSSVLNQATNPNVTGTGGLRSGGGGLRSGGGGLGSGNGGLGGTGIGGYGNRGSGYGSGYGNGYGGGGYGNRNSGYVWVYIPSLGWVMVPIRLLRRGF
jgi:hypothetical protein